MEQKQVNPKAQKHLIKKRKRRKRICKFSLLTWLLLIISSCYFYYVFQTFKMFPGSWRVIAMYGLGVFIILIGILVLLPSVQTGAKLLSGIINILLSACLIFASFYLPSVRSKIEIMFQSVPEEGELEINYYVLNSANSDINEYKDKTFIVQKSTDVENQAYAMMVLKRELLIDYVNTYEVESLWDGVEALKQGLGDVLVLNSTYVPIVEDVTGYENFTSETQIAYTVRKKLIVSDNPTDSDLVTKPFSILLVGNDGWGNKVTTTGRTDVNIVATINPITKQIVFTSMPRDAYIYNVALGGDDKLTHMGNNGIKNTVDSLERYLGIDIDNYVIINFTTFKKIIDALGGIDIENPYEFTSKYGGDKIEYVFPEGQQHLNGTEALAYVRERKSLKNGDIDRNKHQEIVISAMLDKLTTPSVITKVDELLAALEGCFKTNVSLESIYSICQMQLDDMAVWKMKSISVTGSADFAYCASVPSTALSVVIVKESSVTKAKAYIQKVLNGESIE